MTGTDQKDSFVGNEAQNKRGMLNDSDRCSRLAAALGPLWKRHRRALPPSVRTAFAELLLQIRLVVLPAEYLDSKSAIGRARYDVRGITELLTLVAGRPHDSSGSDRSLHAEHSISSGHDEPSPEVEHRFSTLEGEVASLRTHVMQIQTYLSSVPICLVPSGTHVDLDECGGHHTDDEGYRTDSSGDGPGAYSLSQRAAISACSLEL